LAAADKGGRASDRCELCPGGMIRGKAFAISDMQHDPARVRQGTRQRRE
jgi:hypothetical protein